MRSINWTSSVVSRLVVTFCVGGLLLSLGLGFMEYHRSLQVTELATSQQMVMLEQNLQQVLRSLIAHGETGPIDSTLEIFSQDPRVRAVRLSAPDGKIYSGGTWSPAFSTAHTWTLTNGQASPTDRLDLSQETVLVSSFLEGGKRYAIQMVIDGPLVQAKLRNQVINQLSTIWVVLGMLTLLGLLLLRRWLVAPLGRIVGLTKGDAPATVFEETASDMRDEFGELAGSIGRMLRGVDHVNEQLRQRERAFTHLYQFAPVAMISIGADGKIARANRRAAELLHWADENSLVGTPLLDFIRNEDRGLFRQCIDRLELDRMHRCELRLDVDGKTRDVAAELAASHDEDGNLAGVRISFVDVSDSKRLMNQVSDQRRLLDLVVNHMSDAILLVGADRKIIAANRRLATLQRLDAEAMQGQPYDAAEFWARLDLVQPAVFEQRMAMATETLTTPIQEQFETRDGAFLFHVIPVCDETQQPVAQLWVVQEVSAQLRSRRLAEQQTEQLRALQRIGQKLHTAENVQDLLMLVIGELSETLQTEAVGIALRGVDSERRCVQLIWQGSDRSMLEPSSPLSEAVADQLMPRVLGSRSTSFWTDLAQHSDWAGAFEKSGLESMASTALINRDQTQGIVWIARRGGKRIEQHHLFLLEALAPMLATAFDNAQLRQQLRQFQLTDPVTNLPSPRLLSGMISKLVNRPGHPWSLLMVDVDNFKHINDTGGHNLANDVLRQVGQTLRETCRGSDQVIRLERDIFVILCPDLEAPAAANLAGRIRKRVSSIDLNALGVHAIDKATCSIGIACSPHDHTRGELTIDIARQRLAAAKAQGPDHVVSVDQPQQPAA